MIPKILPALLLCATAISHATETATAKKLALAKDYVLASCIIHSYPGTPLATEVDMWAGSIVEQGGLRYADYPTLAALAKQAPAPLFSKQGTPMKIQNCVEFVNGAGFPARLNKVLKR